MNIRRLAGTANLVDSLWIMFLLLTYTTSVRYCLPSGCPSILNSWVLTGLLAIALLLVADSVISFMDRWVAFPAGALLSLVLIPLIVLEWGTFGTLYATVAILLTALAMIFDGLAIFSRRSLPEQNHPLNLPVFG